MNGYEENKQIVGSVGGMLGQMVLVLSIMERNWNRKLTSTSQKSKGSRRSGTSKAQSKPDEDAKSNKSGKKSEAGRSEKSSPEKQMGPYDPSVEPECKEKGWFSK